MFRPFIGQALDGFSNQPHEICAEATQSLLALAQAYDDLFTLRRVPGLMPYFVYISGLFGLAMGDSGLFMDPVYLRAGLNASQLSRFQPREDTPHNEKYNNSDSSDSSPYVQLPAATHARLLLAKMSSGHPTAVVAERLFQEAVLKTTTTTPTMPKA